MRTLTTMPTTTRRSQAPAPVRRAGLIRRAYQEIAPEMIERIAGRVVALLREEQLLPPGTGQTTPELLTVSQLAKHLGLHRTWVYEHAQDLGAIRLGDGPKARLRFNLHTAIAALRQYNAGRADGPLEPQRSARSRPSPYRTDVPLLQPRHREIRGLRSCLASRRARIRVV
jgi:hypothetical protein